MSECFLQTTLVPHIVTTQSFHYSTRVSGRGHQVSPSLPYVPPSLRDDILSLTFQINAVSTNLPVRKETLGEPFRFLFDTNLLSIFSSLLRTFFKELRMPCRLSVSDLIGLCQCRSTGWIGWPYPCLVSWQGWQHYKDTFWRNRACPHFALSPYTSWTSHGMRCWAPLPSKPTPLLSSWPHHLLHFHVDVQNLILFPAATSCKVLYRNTLLEAYEAWSTPK